MEDMLIEYLRKNSIPYKNNVSIKHMSYIKVGGNASVFVKPQNRDQFIKIIKFTHKHNIHIKVMGNFSNTLFNDSNCNEVIVSNKGLNRYNVDLKKDVADVEAGVMLPAFVKNLSKFGITGYEGLIGIPGTVGGSLYTNAGAYGNEISDYLIDVMCIDKSGAIKKISKEGLAFSFRHSSFQKMKNCYILSARFSLIKGNQVEIEKKIQSCQHQRVIHQERKYPNLGSVYKSVDIYNDISKLYPFYRILLRIIRAIDYRLHLKDNRILNFITEKYFSIRYIGLKPFSDKTINCIVNRGDLSFAKAVDFINTMDKILKDSVELEIEVVEEDFRD